MYGGVLATGNTLSASYTPVISVAEKALRQSNKAVDEVEKLTKALEQGKSLAIFARPHQGLLHRHCVQDGVLQLGSTCRQASL